MSAPLTKKLNVSLFSDLGLGAMTRVLPSESATPLNCVLAVVKPSNVSIVVLYLKSACVNVERFTVVPTGATIAVVLSKITFGINTMLPLVFEITLSLNFKDSTNTPPVALP